MKMAHSNTYRDDVLQYAVARYGTMPEYLWLKFPRYAVLRHEDNKRWYAVLMDVQQKKLGLHGEGVVDILNLKCDPIIQGSLLSEQGFMPAYHMQRGCWISVLLDGTVEKALIFSLLDGSFHITAKSSPGKKPRRPGNPT